VDVGSDGCLVVIVRWSSATGGGRGRCRQRRLDQGRRDVGFLGEGGSRALLLLQECSGGKHPGVGGIILLLRVGGGSGHGVDFLSELSGLGSLADVIGNHRRWCRGAQGGSVGHRRCSKKRGGGRLEARKKLGSDYHVGERRAAEYWIDLH
jgi:hypothetical protein